MVCGCYWLVELGGQGAVEKEGYGVPCSSEHGGREAKGHDGTFICKHRRSSIASKSIPSSQTCQDFDAKGKYKRKHSFVHILRTLSSFSPRVYILTK